VTSAGAIEVTRLDQGGMMYELGPLSVVVEPSDDMRLTPNGCGTAGCFAGHAVVLFGDEEDLAAARNMDIGFPRVAARLLGVNMDEQPDHPIFGIFSTTYGPSAVLRMASLLKSAEEVNQ